MKSRRIALAALTAVGAACAALSVAGPGFAKGGGGGGYGGGGGASGGGGSGGSSSKTKPKPKTVLDEIEADTSLAKFTAALKAAGLESTLKGSGPFTVLAPNDAAFGKIEAKLADLMKPANKDKLKSLLEGHILSSKMKAAEIGKAAKLSAMGGVSHEVKLGDDKQPAIDGARIVKSDVEGANGFVQVLDTVLLPPEKGAPPAGK